jgi:hypothetical protein
MVAKRSPTHQRISVNTARIFQHSVVPCTSGTSAQFFSLPTFLLFIANAYIHCTFLHILPFSGVHFGPKTCIWRWPSRMEYIKAKRKSKTILAMGHGGLKRCETSRITCFLANRLTDDGEVFSLMRRLRFTLSPQEDSWYSILLEVESILELQCGYKD